ncbi:hypothetical protein F5B22DRAFT_654440 [Xylaria bambusicola]|uniref:uncharacterized protein n=1 Tax=Xylaria bambusicola TaxID=326684 RepID=UPI0020080C0B|nr:uncharacterized protein F5B22DRAFT_654440 [Xylaria bambusicola]KAI0518124.1 hypothetical protein F5B22DRAFT_654440 [Xylaria bambusicola]
MNQNLNFTFSTSFTVTLLWILTTKAQSYTIERTIRKTFLEKMAATTFMNMTGDSESSLSAYQRQQTLPETLRFRPLPAPLAEETTTPFATLQIPDQPVPCRRCLQDSRVGDEMLLLSYNPFLGKSPYQCASPIYVHSKPACADAAVQLSGGPIPEQLSKRLLSIRAYDSKHMMRGNEVVDGNQLLEACQRLLGDDASAEYCHVHFGGPGCFAVRIEKVSQPS